MSLKDKSFKHFDERLADLKKICASNFIEQDVELINKTIELIYNLFPSSDSEVYIQKLEQSINVAEITVKLMNLDSHSFIATLIYLFFESGDISSEIVETELGQNILVLLSGIKRLAEVTTKNIAFNEKIDYGKDVRLENKQRTQQNENLIKLFLTLASDIRMIIVRLAFRLEIMRTLSDKDAIKQKLFSQETSLIHAPIAHRLGLYNIKTELEELSMKYLHRDMYRTIAKKLNETKQQRAQFIEKFTTPIRTELESMGLKCEVKGRPKSIYSIWNKIKKQGVSFEDVYDLFAIRIILDNKYDSLKEEKADCWKVYSLVTDLYTPNTRRLRDWISNPKTSGYESLHTTVMCKDRGWVEVQIRTRRMDDIAEKGHAAHWKYKEGGAGNENELDKWLSQIRADLESVDKLPEHIDPAKKELYSDEIFIFTPKRELQKISVGGTVLDFAFAIHTTVGSHCTGAKVNGKFQPLNYELKNGDEVEIITSKNQTPKLSWVDIVKSKRAKIKIKRLVQESEYKNLNRGKEIIQYKCNQLKIGFNDEILRSLMTHFNISTFHELYENVGLEKINTSELKEALLLEDVPVKIKEAALIIEEADIELVEKKTKTENYIIIDALGGIGYELAKCCNPIKGDPVFGFITVSKGTKIHNTSCPNANEMVRRFPYRIVEARWTQTAAKASFIADLRIEGENSDILLSETFNLLANEMKLSIRKIGVDEKKNKQKNNSYVCNVNVYVNDKKHLNHIVDRLKSLKSADNVYRI